MLSVSNAKAFATSLLFLHGLHAVSGTDGNVPDASDLGEEAGGAFFVLIFCRVNRILSIHRVERKCSDFGHPYLTVFGHPHGVGTEKIRTGQKTKQNDGRKKAVGTK